MRKLLLSVVLLCGVMTANAQVTVTSTFDTLYLSKPDTFYVNYTNPMTDAGFNDGFVHFPYYYDTSFGGFWSGGFIYSNMTDSATSGFGNMYSAKTAMGYNNSPNYAVFEDYGASNKVTFHGADFYRPQGFYITNSTYAYNAMRDGYFGARKFGDTTGTHSGLPQGSCPDWFKLTITGYHGGVIHDSVAFYLADFRFANDTQDYIVHDWQWVDLTSLNFADSLDFKLTSSDNDPQFGMNTPHYFCMDDFTVLGLTLGVDNLSAKSDVKIYPNPATDHIFIELKNPNGTDISLLTSTGRILCSYSTDNEKVSIPVAHLPNGIYFLQLNNGAQKQTVRFLKQ
jgi:hypothetical protein